MQINRLDVKNFRIFDDLTFEPSSGLNVLFGDNATGKTSVLEAINVLSSLRSFRSAKLSELVRHQSEGYRIVAMVEDAEGKEIPVGFEKTASGMTLKADGKKLVRVSDLAKKLPVQIIHPDSHLLISGGPKQRRRFLDWGVFHVEHSYLDQWRRYEKALRQRNAALRDGKEWSIAAAWDGVISEAAAEIQRCRKKYVQEFVDILPRFTQGIVGTEKVEIEYQPGWDAALSLKSVLEETKARDRRRGFTCSGPHRADLIFKVNEKMADRYVSRGQQKMLVFSFLLAQVELFRQRNNQNCILLLDDLAAELDETHRERLLALLQEMDIQLFITSVRKASINLQNWDKYKLFHVEHGKINEVL